MNIPERSRRYQLPRRKTPSFSSSLLDSILRSIDETNEGGLQQKRQIYDHGHDLTFFASEPKRMSKINVRQTHSINGGEEQMPSLRRAIMIDQWMETRNNKNNGVTNSNDCYVSSKTLITHNANNQFTRPECYVSRMSCRKISSDSISSGATTFTASSASSEQTDTPSTYRSLPNSFTISRKTAEAVFQDDTQKLSSKREGKFMTLTKLRAMKIYGDLKKVKQPISPGSRISTFLYSLFASSSSKKAKIEESIQNFRSLKKSRSIKSDQTMTCTSFSRSCMSKKQHNNGVKRSVKFYPENETVILDRLDRKSTHERTNDLMTLPKYEKRWFTEKNVDNSRNFMVNIEDENENEDDDLFELEIVGGVTSGYGQELPVFETTDLRKFRISC